MLLGPIFVHYCIKQKTDNGQSNQSLTICLKNITLIRLRFWPKYVSEIVIVIQV